LAENNRLDRVAVGQVVFDYAYDDSGNLVREAASRHYQWDHADRLKAFRTQAGAAEPSVYAHYLYDAAGQRVKKLVRRQGGQVETTVYVGSAFEHHRQGEGDGARENNTLHVLDDRSRVALVRVGAPFDGDPAPAVQFHLGDHLGSSQVVIDGDGTFVNREEFTPYGETSFGSFARKRYRFTGQERDGESGLSYHSARHYAPWLGRWVSCDPAGAIDGSNLHRYGRNNPNGLIDTLGTQSCEPEPHGCSADVNTGDATNRANYVSDEHYENYVHEHHMPLDMTEPTPTPEEAKKYASFFEDLVTAGSGRPVSASRADEIRDRWGWVVPRELTPSQQLDRTQILLDIGGLAPVIGEPADLLNATISALRGQYEDAGLSVFSMVPWLGMASTAAKAGRKGEDMFSLVEKGRPGTALQQDAARAAAELVRDGGSKTSAGTLAHELLGANPRGVDIKGYGEGKQFVHTDAVHQELKTHYGPMFQEHLDRASPQSLRYSLEHQRNYGTVPIRIIKHLYIDLKTGAVRVFVTK
jgi:RHS repeat-associated protein